MFIINNIFMVLLISALTTIGATKPMFVDSGSPKGGKGEGVYDHVCVGMVCYDCA